MFKQESFRNKINYINKKNILLLFMKVCGITWIFIKFWHRIGRNELFYAFKNTIDFADKAFVVR